MSYKLISYVIIIGISLYIANAIKKQGEGKIFFCQAMIDFITYIKSQISYFCTPTKELIDGYNNDILEKCGFLSMIKANDWSTAISHSKMLDSRGKSILVAFSSKLGKTSADEQIENCDFAIESLNAILSEYKAEIPKKYKAYSSLAVIVGLMILILLV